MGWPFSLIEKLIYLSFQISNPEISVIWSINLCFHILIWIRITYSDDRLLWHTSNINFGFLQIKWEPMIVQKQMIPHLKGLVMGILISEGEGRGLLGACHAHCLWKVYFLGKKGVATSWDCRAPVLLVLYFPQIELPNEVLWVFV